MKNILLYMFVMTWFLYSCSDNELVEPRTVGESSREGSVGRFVEYAIHKTRRCIREIRSDWRGCCAPAFG